jgi:hypothetical protein
MRKKIVPLLTVLILGWIIQTAWSRPAEKTPPSTASTKRDISMEELLNTVQSKIFVGASLVHLEVVAKQVVAKQVLQEQGESALPSGKSFEEIGTAQMAAALSTIGAESLTYEVQRDAQNLTGSETARYLFRRKLITLASIESPDVAAPLSERLTDVKERTENEEQLDQILIPLLSRIDNGQCGEPLEPLNAELLQDQLGWHGLLVVSRVNCVENPAVDEASIDRFRKFIVFATLFSVGIIGGMVLLFGYLFLFLTRRATFRFTHGAIPRELSLEIFTLYLGLYALMAKALPPLMEGLSNRGIPVNRLALNGGFILATTLCFLWPLTQGIRLRPVLETLGLSLGGVKRVVSDILIAPTYYLASLIVLFGVLLVYSAALQQMNIEMSQGTHPIVPILVSSGDQETRRMIFILAVVIAPFVEEIMFRGAFY